MRRPGLVDHPAFGASRAMSRKITIADAASAAAIVRQAVEPGDTVDAARMSTVRQHATRARER